MTKKIIVFVSVFTIVCLLMNCTSDKSENRKAMALDSLEKKTIISTAPVLSPEKSLRAMVVEAGFEVKLVAAEPLISTPVALTFDKKGRMWVVEMDGYMPDTAGSGEERPTGKIVILEDKNGDGTADERKVFLDSLVLPRAICLVDDGLLVAEPPALYYIEIKNDQPGKKTMVDTAYTEGGNVEHQSNGLVRAMDNWIYSGTSDKRYRKQGDQWITGHTHFRGQWGIAQDDYGRLFYNNNSQNLLGDYFAPGLGSDNTNQHSVAGYNVKIVADNRIYPARPTPGVNRGYMEKILDDSLRLVNFTAACGPMIYRGGLFKKEYNNNAFVAEPAANLIKRNILHDNGFTITGQQAYQNREFLTSIDERFRPVSLYNGPDGALYVVDMYRGIIQHKSFLTDYLKKEIKERVLAQPLNCGRIYKIVPENNIYKPVQMPNNPTALVALLQSPNGWVRDMAQQLLIDGKLTAATSALRKNLQLKDDPLTVIHSLWTMEGLGVLQMEDVLPLLKHSNWKIKVQALSVLSSVTNAHTYEQLVPVLQKMILLKDTITAPYIAFQIRVIQPCNKLIADDLLLSLAKNFSMNKYVAAAIISNVADREADFAKKVTTVVADTSLTINKQFKKILADIKKNEINKDINLLKKQFPRGVGLFTATCQTCHGVDGNGIASLAPPLNNSEWVNGDKDKLIALVLYGLSGPVKVNNKLYKAPEISGEMPGLINNRDMVEEDLAQLLSFIRKNWSNKASTVSRDEVIKIKQRFNNRQKPFTVEELNTWPGQ